MAASPFDEAQKVAAAINSLFPGKDRMRLRNAIMYVHRSLGELPFLSKALMSAVATASRYHASDAPRPLELDAKNQFLPNDFDEWTNYMYSELHAGIGWLMRVEQSMMEMGIELHMLIVQREKRRRAQEEGKAEKDYTKQDAVQYGLYLETLGGGDAGDSSGSGSASGSVEAGGREGGGEESGGGGRSPEDQAAGAPAELDGGGRASDGGPISEATRILRG